MPIESSTIESFIGATILSVIHLFAAKLRFLDVIPRSRSLSIAGGVAVSYVLLHLLPELRDYSVVLAEAADPLSLQIAEKHLGWLVVLLGCVVFFGLESLARRSRQGTVRITDAVGPGVFWLHMVSYGLYNTLIGYLLVREDRGVASLAMFVIGIGLHFLVNDHGLRRHHRDLYRRYGRWLLAAAVLIGWWVGVTTAIHPAVTALTIAFLAGGILLNTFKEELPEERVSRFWPFAAGAAGYAAILLSIEALA